MSKKAGWLILIPLFFQAGCGSETRKALDYFPIEIGCEIKLESTGILEGGKNMILKKFTEETEFQGGVRAIEEQVTRVHGTESKNINTYEIRKDRVVRISFEYKALEGSNSESSHHDETPFTILVLPGIWGNATWTNRGGDIVVDYSARYGKTQVGFQTYPDCLVVEMKRQKAKSTLHYRQYYARDVGWIKTIKVDEKGVDQEDPTNMVRVEP